MKITPQVTKRIKGRPYYAFLYAKNVLKGRLPEGIEFYFKDDPQAAYLYARHVIGGRLPDAVHNALIMFSMERKDDCGFVAKYLDFLEGR